MNRHTIKANVVDVISRNITASEIVIQNGIITELIPIDEVLDSYAIPGLIDAHIHIESSMLVPTEFAKTAVKHGTVATVSDPHEIANVLGIQGVEFMIDNANQSPMKFYFGAPSCVPATPFESSGAVINANDIRKLLARNDIKYLSEMMNFPGVIYNDNEVMAKINAAIEFNKPIDGHIPGISGEDLKKYVSAGITTDHECFTIEEAIEKINLGMKILIREGSAAKNFEALHPLIKSHPEFVMLCSDDKHPNDLVNGHINLLVKRAVALGYDLFDVLRAASYNAIKHYSLECGYLQLNQPADFVIVDNLQDFNIETTIINGEIVFADGKTKVASVSVNPINKFNLDPISEDDLSVSANDTDKIRVIEVIEGQLVTNELIISPKVVNGLAVSDTDRDILKICVIDRYNNGKPSIGFIKNFGLKSGTIATSVAHDSHNIIALGCDDTSMVNAVNTVIQNSGGMSVYDGTDAHSLALPIAGLMSSESAESVSDKYIELENKAKSLGSELHSPFMTLSFMALLVIPSLKIGDKGLFDASKFEFTSLVV